MKVSEKAPVAALTAVEFDTNKPEGFVSETVADVPETPGAGVTVPLIVIAWPGLSTYVWFAAATVTVVPAAKEKNGAKERRRIAAIASTLIPATEAAIPPLRAEFSFITFHRILRLLRLGSWSETV